MPAKKVSVTTPLHLLQQLSRSLIEHFEKACEQASRDADALLEKLEKQRGKTQEKLAKARSRLDEAENAGKAKAQPKVRARLAELEELSSLLQARHSETLEYIAELKRDTAQSLDLAKGIKQVEEAAANAQASRSKPVLKTARATSVRTSPRKKATASEAEPAVKPTQTRQSAKAPAAKKTTVATRPASSRAKPAAAPAAPAKTPPARKPAARKPAAPKPAAPKPAAKTNVTGSASE